jgi:hypothetical protein
MADDMLAKALEAWLNPTEAANLAASSRSASHQYTLEQSWKGWGKLAHLRADIEHIAALLPDNHDLRHALLAMLKASYEHPGWTPAGKR